jgi:hypothetical protein
MPVTGFLRRPPTSPPDASSRDVLGVPPTLTAAGPTTATDQRPAPPPAPAIRSVHNHERPSG